jgi:hypothetical protein
MIELTLADTARAIRPFLPDLAGPAAADLDRQLAALLAATDAGEVVDEQLAAVLGSLKLAGWTTYFLEHGEPPRSWADHRRIVRGNEYSISYATEQFDQRGEVSRVELDDLAPLADTPSYPRLDAPAEVAPGEVFTVTAGLRPDADGALVSTGPMDLPADVELQVALQFDPIAFVLVNPSSTATLRRTPADPWPSAEFRLVALAGQDLRAERRIDVKFLRNGQLVGFASRALDHQVPRRPPPPRAARPRPGRPHLAPIRRPDGSTCATCRTTTSTCCSSSSRPPMSQAPAWFSPRTAGTRTSRTRPNR